MDYWKIKMNLNKTHYIQFGKQIIEEYELVVNEVNIERVKMLSYLGMIFDEKLYFQEHLKE